MTVPRFNLNRRKFILRSVSTIAIFATPGKFLHAEEHPSRIVAGPAMAKLVLDLGPETAVWAFNQQVPGPLLRYRQGDILSLEVENQLEVPTTIHWHGLRVPVEMDGVPFLSQKPIEPGATYHYEFKLHDAGTFWYHPHVDSSQQVGRGLRGALIVDELQSPQVDRDVLWVLDDWRLNQDAQIVPFSDNMRDASHNGRIGNVITVNGNIGEEFFVRAGERLRLRLVNVANSRTFALTFQDLNPWIIALDGHPIEPKSVQNDRIVLGAGQRTDLIVDVTGKPGEISSVVDSALGIDFAYELMRLVRNSDSSLPLHSRPAPPALLPNPVSKPDIANAERHQIVFEGGAMGGMSGAYLNGEFKTMRNLAELGKLWAVNGKIPGNVHTEPPLLTLELGKSYILELINRTAFEHPIHLHGHSFQVIRNNGKLLNNPPIRDTVLLQPSENQEIAFVADNPGLWMFHCHILEHQNTGMTSVIAVT